MKKFLDWAALENELNVLAERTREFTPDWIIGIGKGGMVLAPLLASRLQVEKVASITTPIQQFSEDSLNDANILLVAAFLTQDTQNIISKFRKAKKVKVSSIYIKDRITVDYYVAKVEEVSFPWDH
ncbi:MAG TPA: hypothetical protein VJJ21_03675 [Candidatus Nanoarchaeia archaeon]|nr:hypothetical protein [Candidatus Nanoarchaeia archaeon]